MTSDTNSCPSSARDQKGTAGPLSGFFATGSLPIFILRRILAAIPLILAIVVASFLLIHLAPGDPITVMIGESSPSEEQLAELYARYGLDQPVYVQLWRYVTSALQGDLGYSYVSGAPVLELILNRLPATLLLMLPSLVLFTLAGVAVGVYVAVRPYSVGDNATSFLSVIGYSIPVFWLGQLLLLTFALWLGWLPAQGMRDLRANAQGFWLWLDVAKHMLLPAMVLGAKYLAINARMVRSNMIEALSQDYVLSARAKGLPEQVIREHALRNAILPVVTMFGVNFADSLTGSVLVEIVFGWPGIGRLMYDAVFQRDYPLLMGLFLFSAVTVVIVNILVDIVYSVIDPRVRNR